MAVLAGLHGWHSTDCDVDAVHALPAKLAADPRLEGLERVGVPVVGALVQGTAEWEKLRLYLGGEPRGR